MKKRILSVILCGLLVFSCVPVALAGDDTLQHTAYDALYEQQETNQETTTPESTPPESTEAPETSAEPEPSSELTLESSTAPSPEPELTLTQEDSTEGLYETEGIEDYTYTVNSDGVSVTITGYTGIGGDVTVPDTLEGKMVTEIGANSFEYNASINSISIPNGVVKIGYGAFYECSKLESVTLADSVLYIEPQAFYSCHRLNNIFLPTNLRSIGFYAFGNDDRLTDITIPASVTSVGIGPFEGCLKLTSITVEIGNLNYRSVDGVLFDYAMTKLIQYPPNSTRTSYVIPDGVASIEYTAFYNCRNLSSLTLPESLTQIVGDSETFSQCGIESIKLPASLEIMMGYVFSECYYLKMIEVDETNTYFKSVDGVLFNKSGTKLLQYPLGSKKPNYVVPNGVTDLGDYSFVWPGKLNNLKNMYIPTEVTNINAYAFGYHPSDYDSLTIYGESDSMAESFANEKVINFVAGELTLVSGVSLSKNSIMLRPGETATLNATVIPDNAAVEDVTWQSDNSNIAWVQNGVVTAGQNTGNATIIVTTLDGSYLDTCMVRVEPIECTVLFVLGNVPPITVPFGSLITEPYQPLDLHKSFIGWYPTPEFDTAPISFPFTPTEKVTNIYAKWESPDFTGTSGDYQYWVKNGAATITGYTGSGGEITIPSTLDGYPVCAIGVAAFQDNSKITGINIPDGIAQIGSQAFDGCTSMKSVRLPIGLKTIESSTFYDCVQLSNVVIPNGVACIMNSAFSYCCSLVDITIPQSVTSIWDGAFSRCDKLKKAYFQGNAPTLGGPIFATNGGDGTSVFRSWADSFEVYYLSGKTGFSNPWYGYKTVVYNPSMAYTVHYETQGRCNSINDMQVSYGTSISAPNVVAKRGYYFIGWYSDVNGYTERIQFPYTVYGETTLYSKWTDSPVYLSSLGISAGTLSRAFPPKTYSYKISLGENEPSMTLTPVKEWDGATMTINGKAVSNYTVSLANGKSAKVTVKVKYGKTTKTYTFSVFRAKSTNNNLSGLTATAGSFNTAFSPEVTNYTLALDENTKTTTVRAAVQDPSAKASPSSSKVTLKNGQSKTIKFTVKAQSGTKKTYTVTVTRAKSSSTVLKYIKTDSSKYPLSPAFSDGVNSYTVTLPANSSKVTLSAKAVDSLTSVMVDGKKGSNKFTLTNGQSIVAKVVVTAQSGAMKEYTVTINRL